MVMARTKISTVVTTQVSWKPPPQNWLKLNIDGSFISNKLIVAYEESSEAMIVILLWLGVQTLVTAPSPRRSFRVFIGAS